MQFFGCGLGQSEAPSRSTHRHLSRVGCGRAARQQDRQRGAHHPHAERHCRAVPERALAAPEPRPRLFHAARPANEAELQRREAATDAMNATKTDIGWGHQIRSYVLQPYQMVKDLRTGVETSNTGAVLDGDLDRFLAAALAARIEGADAIPTNG